MEREEVHGNRGKSRYLCSLSDRGDRRSRALIHQARDEVKQTRPFQWKKFTDFARQFSLSVRASVAGPNPSLAAWDCFSTVETEFCRVGGSLT